MAGTTGSDPEPGALIAGRYTIAAPLGAGAHKEVFRAFDHELGREVAIARLRRPPSAEGPEGQRFRQEIHAMARIGDHARIVSIHDVITDDDATYIVSQYVSGGSLSARLRSAAQRRLDRDEATAVAIDVAEALACAHADGIVHRDVKPANVLLTPDGRALLADFGIATLAGAERITATGMVMGTVDYLAPEAIRGRAGPAADVYALGVLLYEVLCGCTPFADPDVDTVLRRHLFASPVPPSRHRPDVPGPLENLVLAMLAKDPGQRPASASDVADALRVIAGGGTATAVARPAAPFVGRGAELGRLERAIQVALDGTPQVAIVTGEPGIGKTAIVTGAARFAELRGARVGWSHCFEQEGAPPYAPWGQLLTAYAARVDDATLAATIGSLGATAVRMVPELAHRLPVTAIEHEPEPEQARFAFMEQTTALVRRIVADRALVLVFEDVQWIDAASALLLEFLLRELTTERLCILVTGRDEAFTRDGPMAGLLAPHGAGTPVELRLAGLGAPDVEALLTLDMGVGADVPLAQAVHDKTDGNPFFVREIAQLLAATAPGGATVAALEQLGLPGGVRDAVSRRVGACSPACRLLLNVSAVLGREFRLDVAAHLAGLSRQAAVEAIDEAIRAQLADTRGRGRYRFAHALIRETLYGQLDRSERLAAHRRTGELLEAAVADGAEPDLDQLAYHWYCASELDGADRAVDYSRRAAAAALDRLAYETAADHLRHALEALELGAMTRRGVTRCELLLELGDAAQLAGDFDASQEAFEAGAGVARRCGLPDHMARATLGHTTWRFYGVPDTKGVAMLRDALAVMPAEDSSLRAQLLSVLAHRLEPRTSASEKQQLSAEAVAMARRIGDDTALPALLRHRFGAIRDPSTIEQQAADAQESLRLAERAADQGAAAWAQLCLYVVHLERCEIIAAETALASYRQIADELRQPYLDWYATMLLGTHRAVQGRFAEAEDLSLRALQLREEQESGADEIYVAQRFMLEAARGTLATWDTSELERLAEEYVVVPAWRAMLVAARAASGARAEVAEMLAREAVDGFAGILGSEDWLTALALLADPCALVGDRPMAERLHALLEPWADHHVVFNYGWATFGATARAVGRLRLQLGRGDAAEALERARRLDTRVGARAWLVHDWTLLAEARDGTERAQALEQARNLGRELAVVPGPGLVASVAELPTR
jgi:eukaryotic-like serine/threonine-protein kinase